MMGGWNEIGPDGGSGLLDLFGGFHDSCIKEARYVSGAYVDGELAMWPYNDKRTLILLIQRQESGPAVIELAFDGVECFHLEPSGEEYDGSIFRAEFHWSDGGLWWADTTDFDPENPPYGQQFSWVRARSARWRIRDAWLGEALVYDPEAPPPPCRARIPPASLRKGGAPVRTPGRRVYPRPL